METYFISDNDFFSFSKVTNCLLSSVTWEHPQCLVIMCVISKKRAGMLIIMCIFCLQSGCYCLHSDCGWIDCRKLLKTTTDLRLSTASDDVCQKNDIYKCYLKFKCFKRDVIDQCSESVVTN